MTYATRARILAAAFVSIIGFVNNGYGDVISQSSGKDYLVVEAEDVDSFDDPFESEALLLVTADSPVFSTFGSPVLPEDTNASGQAALYTQPGFGFNESVATWKLQFAKAGEYTLYYHYSLFEEDFLPDGYGNEDSFFLALDFGQRPEDAAGRSNLGNQGHNNPRENPPYWEGQFHWQVATLANGRAATYVVSDDQVDTILDFSLGNRERGSTLDLLAFHPDGSLVRSMTEEELDALFLGGDDSVPLQAGDANMDYEFNQLDLVQVQVAATYLTGQAATWGQGDWNGAPGGSAGDPPAGDGGFDQRDIIAALTGGKYLTGPYGALTGESVRGDAQTSITYDPATGEVTIDAPAGIELTSTNIDSAAGIFIGDAAQNLGGSFDNDADANIFKATFGSSFGSVSFGNVAQRGLSEEFLLGDLTAVGSLAGGGDLGNVDLVYVPEPSTIGLFLFGLLLGLVRLRHVRV